MGFLGFGKKKESLPPTVQSMAIPEIPSFNTDLPSIDGNNIPTMPPSTPSDLNNIKANLPDMQQLPPLDPLQVKDNKSISINVPTLDFSMPLSDEEQAPIQAPSKELSEPKQSDNSIDVEDLNNLFIRDDWKEPDFNNFEPYTEDKIEEPKPEDFTGAELPQFEDTQISEPVAPIIRSDNTSRPVELFIRGRAYSRVFVELDEMSSSLILINSKSGNYEEILKREDELLFTAKEQMEYLYKKITNIDKKIFAQQ